MGEQKKYVQKLPDFIPYKILKLCSNILCVRFIIEISGFYPIIIGRGEIPLVWLFVKMDNVILPLVEKNLPRTPQIKIFISESTLRLSVYDINKKDWVELVQIVFEDPNEPDINYIDLRPIGISLFGNENELNIGGLKLANNRFEGSEVLVGID